MPEKYNIDVLLNKHTIRVNKDKDFEDFVKDYNNIYNMLYDKIYKIMILERDIDRHLNEIKDLEEDAKELRNKLMHQGITIKDLEDEITDLKQRLDKIDNQQKTSPDNYKDSGGFYT